MRGWSVPYRIERNADGEGAQARAADGDYKTKGLGHEVRDADGDYKATPKVQVATAAAGASNAVRGALIDLPKGGY